MTIKIPKKHKQYRWIANEFAAVKGVESVTMDFTDDGMNLLCANGKDGDEKKAFEFPLRRLFFTEYAGAGDVKNAYDILELDDPAAMVKIGKAKANVFFNDVPYQTGAPEYGERS